MPKQLLIFRFHNIRVLGFHFRGIQFNGVTTFKVDEAEGAVLKIEIVFFRSIANMEENHLMLIISEMFEGGENTVIVRHVVKHIAKNNHEGAFMCRLCYLV